MKRAKHVHSEGIKLADDQQIKEVEIDKGYKYLGILEADGGKEGYMKEKIVKEYYRRYKYSHEYILFYN